MSKRTALFFIGLFTAWYLLCGCATVAKAAPQMPDDKLFEAIAEVESNKNPKKRNAGEDAVGIVQIRRILVDDVNRVLKLQGKAAGYTYNDRWDPAKSREMFDAYLSYYARERHKKGKRVDYEALAKMWNGGPTGPEKPATQTYWSKVKREMGD
jgi:hypothetical protein